MLKQIVGETGKPGMVQDIRSGRAGFLPRFGLSLAAAASLVGVASLGLGIIDQSGRVQEEQFAIAFGLVGMIWCGVLVVLWMNYRRFARFLMMGLAIMALWLFIIPLCIWVGRVSRSEEFFIIGLIFFGICGTIVAVCVTFYSATRGRPLRTESGEIDVRCPGCDYSMVGLRECTCPECGEEMTVDQLIREQGYEAIKQGLPQPESNALSPASQAEVATS